MYVDVLPDRAALMRAAAEEFVKVAGHAQAARGRCSVALSGGSTPAALYTLLASADFARRMDWSHVQVFWGDERCVPPDHPQSNYRMAKETLLSRVPLPAENVHRIRGEDDPKQAAAAYEELLRQSLGGEGLDLVLLGMGDNGHTASLFPGLPGVSEPVRWVLAQYVEVVSMWRVTLTPAVINAADHVTFLVAGSEKADRLREVLEGPTQVEVLPSQAIQPTPGELHWLVDAAAAARLERRR
ncbi:MAG: 6-phosphogluconolactonase [Candidatus Rokuibacteriota bacterium]